MTSITSANAPRSSPICGRGGQYVALDVDEAGGIGLIAQRMIAGGLVNGSMLTPTGRTLAEETAHIKETPGQKVIATAEHPFKPTGGIVHLAR